MAVRAASKSAQPVMLRFEEGVAPDRSGPALGAWQAHIPTQASIDGTFPKTIIQQGLAAFQRSKVRSLNLRRTDIVGTVADTETHTTTLTRDESRLPLRMRCNCTCRYGYDCKHAVAALYTLIELSTRDAEQAPAAAAAGAPAGNGHSAGNGKTSTNGEQRTNGHSATVATAAAPDLLDLLTPHHESVAPRRRLWVVVGFDDRLGIFYARLALDAPKLHGVPRTHGDLQQLYRTTRQANLTGEEWDRHDAALLADASLGTMFGTPADYALARATSEQTKGLTNNFAQLLLRLIAHPRVRCEDHLGAHPEAMPAVRIALAPLRLRLNGTRDEHGDLELRGVFVRPDGSEVDVAQVKPIDGTPAWLFDGGTFYLHDGSFSLRIVERLLSSGGVRIAANEIPVFLERAHGFLDRDTAAALMVLPDEMSLQTLLRLCWQGDGITVEASVEDARSGANWRVTPQDFNPLQRVDSGKKGVEARYAYCAPATAHRLRARIEGVGCRPARDVYEQLAAQRPDETVPQYDETTWRIEPTDAAYQFGTESLPAWRTDYQLDMDDTVKSLVEGPK
ncbi:MAG: SWIM zinc finger family protein, partial [Candidatus Eremiobacteraeota bacterium]|nr:SWIM zinc finger family protein [Candidatus Eremiobacteraeota bacterium]